MAQERIKVGRPWAMPGTMRPWMVVRERLNDYGDSRDWVQVETLGLFETAEEADALALSLTLGGYR